ncbi:MAG: DUF928 domain-containing protein, partial [Phormidesmis sp.]
MFVSNLPLPIFVKASSALLLSTALWLSSNPASASSQPDDSILAQTNLDLSEPAAFEPPANPRPARGTLTTTTGTYFRPPSNPRPRSGSHTTTGTRQGGCLSNTETPFTIFGPETTVGRMLSTRPEFVWYLPESDVDFPVIFRLLAPNESDILVPIYTAELPYTEGFATHQLPSDAPALAANTEYRWQVVIACNPNYPSRSLAQELSFEVVPASASLNQSLSTSASATERALA